METAKTRQDEATSPRQPHQTTQVPDVKETGHGATGEKIWGRGVSRFAQCAEIGIMCFFSSLFPTGFPVVSSIVPRHRDPLPTPVHRDREWRAGNHGKILGNPGPPQPCNPAGHLPPAPPSITGFSFLFVRKKRGEAGQAVRGAPLFYWGLCCC